MCSILLPESPHPLVARALNSVINGTKLSAKITPRLQRRSFRHDFTRYHWNSPVETMPPDVVRCSCMA